MTRRGWAELVALLAPPACAACRAPLLRADALLCGGCLRDVPWLRGWRCPRCALPRHGRGGCPAATAAFDGAWAATAYDGSARALVQALKLRAALPAAGLMAAQIAATLPDELLAAPPPSDASTMPPPAGSAPSGAPAMPPPAGSAPSGASAMPPPGRARGPILVAVPPQAARRRARGFDPAGALARSLAPRLALPLVAGLARHDRAGRQARAGRRARQREGRIVVEATRPIGGPVLLVDDVHTTGATLGACARALREAGAPSVVAVTYARTLLSSAAGT
jgi:predicted amidophosphoribosyltransferase